MWCEDLFGKAGMFTMRKDSAVLCTLLTRLKHSFQSQCIREGWEEDGLLEAIRLFDHGAKFPQLGGIGGSVPFLKVDARFVARVY